MRTKSIFKRALPIGLGVALLLSGLLTGRAQGSNSITISVVGTPNGLNLAYAGDPFGSLIKDLILEGAWTYDSSLTLVPRLAAEIPSVKNGGISADGKVITIKVRPDAVWSDGQPITADDFVFTAEAFALDGNRSILQRAPYYLAKVTAPDKSTVVVTFNDVYAAWPATLFRMVLPAHLLKAAMDANHSLDGSDWNLNLNVGSGPFVLKQYDHKANTLLFVRNDTYFGDKAKLDQITVLLTPDAAAQSALLKAGAADLGLLFNTAQAADLAASAPIQILTAPAGYNEGLSFNLNNPILGDVTIRKALTLAIDRTALINSAENGIVKPSAGFWDEMPYQDPSLTAPAFDPIAAGKLLDGAGWKIDSSDGIRAKGGAKLILRLATNQMDFRVAALTTLQAQFRAVGVDTEPLAYPNETYFADYDAGGPLAAGQFDLAEFAARPRYPDPDTNRFLSAQIPTDANNYSGTNWSRLSDPALDKLFDSASKTVDVPTRTKLFNQISKLIADKAYWIPLWQAPDIWAVNKRLTGILLSGAAPWWNAADWSVSG